MTPPESLGSHRSPARLRLTIRGTVQGVGFRPFLYRLATEMDLSGWAANSPQGVILEVEGGVEQLHGFQRRVEQERPPHSHVESVQAEFLPVVGYQGFEIRASDASGRKTTAMLPDLATCAECLMDVATPGNRRFRYPFTNCTHCGPRFSIIEALPYDRPNTTMKRFRMCPACLAEYEDPRDRRFHAQPNACPICGPHLELWDPAGAVLASQDDALLRAADRLREGRIVAVKGLGGFHLLVDARQAHGVLELRRRKQREEKPFALMFPGLDIIRRFCRVSELEECILTSAEAPIVLLERLPASDPLAPALAPGNPSLGVMLPYTPLHHLLMAELNFPVVATSGNLSDEPICTDEREALTRLAELADFFLVHDRPIARHVDDSIVRQMAGREMVLRRARGYAPLPVRLADAVPPLLAVGAHLKNTVAVSVGSDVFLSQHVGDLDTPQAFAAFQEVQRHLCRLYEQQPAAVACDLHPDYRSTHFAHTRGLPVIGVQHHEAHVLACMAEHHLRPPVLGVSWDGTGYGTDGTVWGGEFFEVTDTLLRRFGHWRTFALPGGEQAVREPRRSALGLLYEVFGAAVFEMIHLAPVRAFSTAEKRILRDMLRRRVHAPRTSSVGRLFDALAALLDIRQVTRYEGQSAMALEFAALRCVTDEAYDIPVQADDGPAIVDWEPLVRAMLTDLQTGRPASMIAARAHNAMVNAILAVARQAAISQVVLSGGCFQNRYLTERAVQKLQQVGFEPFWHRHVPPNDGGIALGQVLAAARRLTQSEVASGKVP